MKVSVTTLSLPELDVDLLLLPVAESGLGAVQGRLAGPAAKALKRAAGTLTPSQARRFCSIRTARVAAAWHSSV